MRLIRPRRNVDEGIDECTLPASGHSSGGSKGRNEGREGRKEKEALIVTNIFPWS
jgi:hypothetical protein